MALLPCDIRWMSRWFERKILENDISQNDYVEAGCTKFTHTYMGLYVHVSAVSLVLHSIASETFGNLSEHAQRHLRWGVSWSNKISISALFRFSFWFNFLFFFYSFLFRLILFLLFHLSILSEIGLPFFFRKQCIQDPRSIDLSKFVDVCFVLCSPLL